VDDFGTDPMEESPQASPEMEEIYDFEAS
jgi:hypothetical protein